MSSTKTWLNTYTSSGTRKLYQLSQIQFEAFYGSLQQFANDIRSGKISLDEAKGILADFYTWLDKRGLTQNTKVIRLRGILSYLAFNNIILKLPRHMLRKYSEKEVYYVPTKEEIYQMIMGAKKVREKAILLFLAQTGQRISILTALKVKHINFKQNPPVVVKIPENFKDAKGKNVNKGRRWYYFLIPQETLEMLALMLKEREKYGEKITSESWLFRSYMVWKNGKPTNVKWNTPALPITRWGISNIIRNACKRVGLYKRVSNRDVIHAHTFRRFVETNLAKAEFSKVTIDFIMGRSQPYETGTKYARGAYRHYDPEWLREQWIEKGVDRYLNILASERNMQASAIIETLKYLEAPPEVLNEVYTLLRTRGINEARKVISKRIRAYIRKQLYGGGLAIQRRYDRKIINESELDQYSTWEIKGILPSGKILVERLASASPVRLLNA